MNKFAENDTNVGRACSEILLALIEFIIKNESDEEDDFDDQNDEFQIPTHLLYGINDAKKEKIELDLNSFYTAFSKNLSLLVGFINESEYQVRFHKKIINLILRKKFSTHNTTVRLNNLASQN